ncbi:ABC transporter integral membrane type 1 [Penicillium nucicola]|uniref:ABC transporter integral membrane type 1 n=1 Tax=Penicillium nucicola TaxID=1850975 RepID=UPI002545509B|nr:ABC transporter integral membrane type 1 [Penicillium nucicola]KAJ5756882.1 ABC transporter integral membrane type 1 [Penicillium nucicola]
MHIRPGEMAGACGRTGRYPSRSIRERLITVPQDPFTLLGTIRYNVNMMGVSSDSQITSLSRDIVVWVAIESPGALDAVLEDHPLSQGKQQLFSLARAILKSRISHGGCQVLILDKPTSRLDAQTDQRRQKVMRDAFHDCTLTVAQLDTIIDFDQIAVLNSGCLFEFDTPLNIRARDGLFQQIHSGTDEQKPSSELSQ